MTKVELMAENRPTYKNEQDGLRGRTMHDLQREGCPFQPQRDRSQSDRQNLCKQQDSGVTQADRAEGQGAALNAQDQ